MLNKPLIVSKKYVTFNGVDEKFNVYMEKYKGFSLIKKVLKDNLINEEKFMYSYGSLIVNKINLKKT